MNYKFYFAIHDLRYQQSNIATFLYLYHLYHISLVAKLQSYLQKLLFPYLQVGGTTCRPSNQIKVLA